MSFFAFAEGSLALYVMLDLICYRCGYVERGQLSGDRGGRREVGRGGTGNRA